jgi:hypothetical protein
MPERRYSDDEVTEIFRLATTQPPRLGAATDGLTLAELTEIGREVGISKETVAAAARAVDAAPHSTTQTLLGLPIGVARTVTLDRAVSDAEWDHLVVAARETFAARGTLRQDGAFRQWTNSNLQVLLEPTVEGHRLQFRTLNGHARRMILGGIAVVALAGVITAAALLSGAPEVAERLDGMAILAGVGAVMLARGIWGLRRWAARREAQFVELAGRLRP